MGEAFGKVVFGRWKTINESDLPGTSKDMLRALLFYARDKAECFPGIDTLARDLSIDPRAVRKRLHRLEELGVIRRETGQNQRLIRIMWGALERDDSPPNPEPEFRVPATKPGTSGQGGRNSSSANPEPEFRKPGTSVPHKRALREQEESIEESGARTPKSRKSHSRKSDPLRVEFPPSLDTPEIRDAWADWVATRRESRKSLQPTSARLAIGKLERAGPEAALEALRASAANGWQGVFPEKYTSNGKGTKHAKSGLRGAAYNPDGPEPTF